MAAPKSEFTSEFQEWSPDAGHQKAVRTSRAIESTRLGLTVLALLSAITILGTSADTLAVYNQTHLSEEFFLALWPSDFDIRPTTALVICGTIVILSSIVSLAVSRVPSIRNKLFIHNSISFLTPTISLIAGLIATSFFYGVNASTTNFSLQSWSCQWSGVDMTVAPHWDMLCKESKVALYLTVMIIPLQVLVLGTVTFGVFAEKKTQAGTQRKGSPAMS